MHHTFCYSSLPIGNFLLSLPPYNYTIGIEGAKRCLFGVCLLAKLVREVIVLRFLPHTSSIFGVVVFVL